ncbi:MAG: lipoprotein-releasing system permease protein [Bradymonadia bacterium]
MAAFEALVGWRYQLRRRPNPRILIAGIIIAAIGGGLAWWGYSELNTQGRSIALFGDTMSMWRLIMSIGGGIAAFGVTVFLFGIFSLFLTVFSAFSAFMVAIGVAEVILVLGVMNGFQGDLRKKIIETEAHIMIEPAKTGDYLSDYKGLAEKARGVEGVVGATAWLRTEVMLSAPRNLAAVALTGVDTETVGQANKLPTLIKHGTLEELDDPNRLDVRLRKSGSRLRPAAPSSDPDDRPESPDAPSGGDDADAELAAMGMAFPTPSQARKAPPPSLLLGAELRRNLSLWPGEGVNVISPFGDLGPTGPVPKSRPFRLSGWFESGMLEYDTKLAYASLAAVQHYMGLGDVAGAVQVRVTDLEQARGVRDALRAALPEGVRITDWTERNQNLFSALKLEKIAMFLVLTINILLAAFSIISTLVMTIIERKREIAILMAMGSTSRSILRIFMSQGAFTGVLGALIGSTLGLSGAYVLASMGLPLNTDVYYIDAIPVDVRLADVLAINAVAVLVSLVSTVYPARYASRLRPVEGLNAV